MNPYKVFVSNTSSSYTHTSVKKLNQPVVTDLEMSTLILKETAFSNKMG